MKASQKIDIDAESKGNFVQGNLGPLKGHYGKQYLF